jgi:hypothetical protein
MPHEKSAKIIVPSIVEYIGRVGNFKWSGG